MTPQPIPIHEQACFTSTTIPTVTYRAYNKDGTTASLRYTCAWIDGYLWASGRGTRIKPSTEHIDSLEALHHAAITHLSALWTGCNIRRNTPIPYEPEEGDSVYALTGMRLTYVTRTRLGFGKAWQLFRGDTAALQYPTLADGIADNPSRWVL